MSKVRVGENMGQATAEFMETTSGEQTETGKHKPGYLGHRKRVRKRYLAEGLDNMEEYEVLELLLFYVFKQQDTKALAKYMLKNFDNSLVQVMNASREKLMELDGIGEATATLFPLIVDVIRYVDRLQTKTAQLNTTASQAAHLRPFFVEPQLETMLMMCLNAKNNCLSVRRLSTGTSRQAFVNVAEIAREAVRTNADKVVLAHNHPNGNLQPSSSDRSTTSMVRQALAVLGVTLLDHLIVCDDKYQSMVTIAPTLEF